jgi:hypothetical protein
VPFLGLVVVFVAFIPVARGWKRGSQKIDRANSVLRLMKEIPEIEQKIAEGYLNLSNVAQAQSAFNELKLISLLSPAQRWG